MGAGAILMRKIFVRDVTPPGPRSMRYALTPGAVSAQSLPKSKKSWGKGEGVKGKRQAIRVDQSSLRGCKERSGCAHSFPFPPSTFPPSSPHPQLKLFMMLSFFNGPQYTRDISWAIRQVPNWLVLLRTMIPRLSNVFGSICFPALGITHLAPRAM